MFAAQEQVRYSDNWFDIFPGRGRTIRMWSQDGRRIDPGTVAVDWR
ncbi:MAG: hypothetical protein H0U16_01045 [Actinobacteria bacterium]|nr:hypothetical protein [Actinomycetota bacterium]